MQCMGLFSPSHNLAAESPLCLGRVNPSFLVRSELLFNLCHLGTLGSFGRAGLTNTVAAVLTRALLAVTFGFGLLQSLLPLLCSELSSADLHPYVRTRDSRWQLLESETRRRRQVKAKPCRESRKFYVIVANDVVLWDSSPVALQLGRNSRWRFHFLEAHGCSQQELVLVLGDDRIRRRQGCHEASCRPRINQDGLARICKQLIESSFVLSDVSTRQDAYEWWPSCASSRGRHSTSPKTRHRTSAQRLLHKGLGLRRQSYSPKNGKPGGFVSRPQDHRKQ